MNRVLRAIVTCLLLVAVPLQGYAAGTMLFCGPSTAASGAPGHHGDGSPAPDERAAHHHEAAPAAADDATTPNLHDVMHGKCSVCSSCCSAAALPSALIAATAATPQAAPFPDFEHANPGHGPARLERPPRPNLA
jgi:hypothetical protein